MTYSGAIISMIKTSPSNGECSTRAPTIRAKKDAPELARIKEARAAQLHPWNPNFEGRAPLFGGLKGGVPPFLGG